MNMSADGQWNGRELRVLLLTDYFPKPRLLAMGAWALVQARALVSAGAVVRVVSPTSWIPGMLGNVGRAKPFADCPAFYDWGNLPADYPRWFYYSFKPMDRFNARFPRLACKMGWWTLRGKLTRLVREFEPDVIFAHHTVPGGVLAAWLHAELGIPFITQDHDFHGVSSALENSGRGKLFQQVAERAALRTGVAKAIVRSLNEISSASPTDLLHMSADALVQEPKNDPRAGELAGKTVIFTAAIFYTRKRIPLLIEAFAQVAAKYPQAILRIGGDGHERPAVEEAIRRTGMNGRVVLLGLLDHDRVIGEMVGCDIFALVGVQEPMAVVYMEAMSAGKPVVCCSDGGLADLIENGVNAIAVPPDDVTAVAQALDRLLGDAELRERMGAAGKELFNRQMETTAVTRQLLAMLRAAADQRGNGSLKSGA